MFTKILLCIYFVGAVHCILIDPGYKHGFSDHARAWQVVKVYHPPASHGWYKQEYYPHTYPKYDFQYSVSDKKTGDHKNHQESRDGDRVWGEYSLVEPDGSLRKVEYNADDHNGFNALVSKTVNKHGDHAISISGHARHFHPIGSGVKIHHFFPEKYSNYHHDGKSNEKESKPVKEEVKKEEVKMVVIDGDKMMLLEPVPIENTPNEIKESDTTPTVMPMNEVNDTPKVEEPVAPVTEKNEVPSENLQAIEESKKDNVANDSDVASSYYHSKYYKYYYGY